MLIFRVANKLPMITTFLGQHYAAFHLGLHCLSMYPFTGFQYEKGFIKELLEPVSPNLCEKKKLIERLCE